MTFGLSMDYEIFLLTRIRERFLHSGNTRDAVAYGVSTSARTITSAALIMIAVFVGFAFAGMPLVAEIGVACAVAIAVDATVVRLVMVPALMAMFAQWNWWLPSWLSRVLPSVDFDRPLPEVDLGDVVVIPDDISALVAPSADLRMVLKSAAKLKHLAPDAICVTDPLAFSGCGRGRGQASSGPDEERTRGLGPGQIPHQVALGEEKVAVGVTAGERKTATNGHANGSSGPKKLVGGLAARNGIAKAISGSDRPVHPVTLWRGRLSVAIDALETDPDAAPAGPPTVRGTRGAARWRRPMCSCPPATGCWSRPARRPCGSRATSSCAVTVAAIMPTLQTWWMRWNPRPPRWCWPEWTGITVVNRPGGNASPPSWSVDSQIPIRATTRKTRGRKPTRTRTGRGSGNAACPWR